MESFLEIKKRFDFSIPDMINDIMMSLSKDIIELNQVEQLSEGIDAKGQRIKTISAGEQKAGNVYGFQSIQERQARGLQVNKVDLNFTGIFWKTFKLIKITGGWLIEMDFTVHGDDIRENFESKFDFSGLTNDNLEFLIHHFLFPRLNKRILKRVGL